MANIAKTYTITHEDGSAVTPQEFYDAFMSGPVILEAQGSGDGIAYAVTRLDYDGTPSNVTACYFDGPNNTEITLGGA